MSITASIWLIILAALVAANLPFINQRLAIVGPIMPARKPLWLRLVEMLALYLLVGGIGMMLEHRAGQNAPQGWEFYAVTGALFLTLAFPGFVYRYLVHRKG